MASAHGNVLESKKLISYKYNYLELSFFQQDLWGVVYFVILIL